MENFTPISALIGGGLIGLSVLVFFVGLGRVAGISGIVGSLMTDASGRAVRAAFVIGLLLGAAGFYYGYGMPPAVEMQVASLPWLIAAGLLVGFGTRLGSGCTSGHGVCGLSRGSPRSLVATGTFFVVALVTVYIVRHVL